jgi:hypothetical protein
MPSSKLLNGVAHDILHHAMSGLSCLHQHLSQTCRTAGVTEITLDLMRESPLPTNIPVCQPLILACRAVHRKFLGIVESVGLTLADVAAARLIFHIVPDAPDDYSYFSGTSEVVTAQGRIYRYNIPAFCATGRA